MASVVFFNSGEWRNSVLAGFTIRNGYGSTTPEPYGGGIHCDDTSPTITGNIIQDNLASGRGGGMLINGGNPLIVGNIICMNIAYSKGGGIACFDGTDADIVNNMIHNNDTIEGGGIYSTSSINITNNTIYDNSALDDGGGLYCLQCYLTVENTILWENGALYGDQIYENQANVTAWYCDIQGGWIGTGNIDSDPLFSDSANGDFHLTFPSPCKDAGDTLAVTELTDFEGDPRVAYGTVDIGADEFYTHLYYTGNAAPGGNVEINFVGLPGTVPVGLCIGMGVLDPPIPSMWGDWYLKFPIIGPIVIPSPIPSTGVLIIPGTIPGTPPAPYSIPMQALVWAELSNLCVLEIN
jgi:hypothetical protein